MKLKNALFYTFLVLTFIPSTLVCILLYNSGYQLSKESYTRNLIESIHIQSDYISQSIENDMVSDYRFAKRSLELAHSSSSPSQMREELLIQFRNYLENSGDKISICTLLDADGGSLYSIGEKSEMDHVLSQLPDTTTMTGQTIVEFELGIGVYSLGIITPVRDQNNVYLGCLVSLYDKSHVFKTISSYYEIADTYTYICRANGDIINARGLTDEAQNAVVEQVLSEINFQLEGSIDVHAGDVHVMGFYSSLYNSPWVLVGVIDQTQLHHFLNQFVWVYILIVMVIFVADAILAVYFSHKVVEPINSLIQVMDGYPESLRVPGLQDQKAGYFETQYLRTKFFNLMHTIQRVQHNFEGVYQLYQSSTMDDTNIEIDTIGQTIGSNKEAFCTLMDQLEVPDNACIVERFTRCFCDSDQVLLMAMFENMRDEHLSFTREVEVFTPHFGQKWFHTLVVPMYEDSRLSRLFIQLRDVSSFKKQQMETSELAKRDPLTGLYNRGGFIDCANKILLNGTEDSVHGLLFMDINNFKLVNDNFGHGVGDNLLCMIGNDITAVTPDNTIVSRFGGDEFVLLIPNTSSEQLTALKETLVNKLTYPYETSAYSFTISASIGVSTWTSQNPSTLEDLLWQADTSMYEVKRIFKLNNPSKR